MYANIFGKFDHLLGSAPLNQDEQDWMQAHRGKIAAGDYSRHLWYLGIEGKYMAFPKFLDQYEPHRVTGSPRIRLVAVAEYLFSGVDELLDGIFDPNDANSPRLPRLERELRAWAAREQKTSPEKAVLEPGTVSSYCKANNVEALEDTMLVALRLLKPDFHRTYPNYHQP